MNSGNDFAYSLKDKGMEVEDGWWIVWHSALKYHIRHEHKEEKWLFVALHVVALRGIRGNGDGIEWKVWRCEKCQAQVPDAALGMLSMARREEEV